MKVLVVGNGGREHALVWKIAGSPLVSEVIAAPGSDVMREVARLESVSSDDIEGQVALAVREAVDLVVVGPEAPLVAGLADRLREKGIQVFGPSAKAAQLEGSKVFSKEFMDRHGIPTADFSVHEDVDSALRAVEKCGGKCVIKADGLAAGKGVIVCNDKAEAESAVQEMLVGGRFGDAGTRILVEDRLDGEEASILAIADGEKMVTLVAAQDHKAAYEGDTGPNTGGMGAYAPAPVVTDALMRTVKEQVLERTVAGMAKEGTPFSGVLYAGIMICDGKPYVLEFNVRFGDPECQPLLALMKQDIVPLLTGAASGELDETDVDWHDGAVMCVVLTSGGYPGGYEKGKKIEGLDAAGATEGVTVFHAGTKKDGDDYVTSGGRVLGVTALGNDLRDAATAAYDAADKIRWEGLRMRRDIGHRAL